MLIAPAGPSLGHYEWQIPAEALAAPVHLDVHPSLDRPHLILHFDMNKTLIASDKEGQKSPHDVICSALSEELVDLWDDALTHPVDYSTYVKHNLLPNEQNSKEIKLKQKEKISQLLEFLRETNHPLYGKAQEVYDRSMAALANQKTQVFPSFYKMIEALNEKGVPYTLVIRTYGSEAPEVAEELNARFGEGFIADFRSIRRGILEGTESNLYDMIKGAGHHLAIRDDWEWWFSHGEEGAYGKPFPIDLNDSKRISLFFDDNAHVDPKKPKKNIVAPYDVHSGEALSPEELIEQDRLFPVEMLKALYDEDYYLRLVERALGQFAE